MVNSCKNCRHGLIDIDPTVSAICQLSSSTPIWQVQQGEYCCVEWAAQLTDPMEKVCQDCRWFVTHVKLSSKTHPGVARPGRCNLYTTLNITSKSISCVDWERPERHPRRNLIRKGLW